MSLDGFVAGPSQSVDNPLGLGGMRLHEWVFPLTVWPKDPAAGNDRARMVRHQLGLLQVRVDCMREHVPYHAPLVE